MAYKNTTKRVLYRKKRASLKENAFILVFVLITLLSLATLLSLLRLEALKEISLARSPLIRKEASLSLSALSEWCRQQFLDQNKSYLILETKDIAIDCSLPDYHIIAYFSLESKRFNIITNDIFSLKNSFEDLGIPQKHVDIMVDSLLDWIDQDNEHRINGAEKDFYMKKGYFPRNGPLKTLDEIVLIRGFDPYIFWIKPALYKRITIYTSSAGANESHLQIYREELKVTYKGKSWCYLEIFKKEPTNIYLLYKRKIPCS